ncbi:MAG: FmdB family zinc ribbon protein [Desulfovibrio sp.]
MPALTNKEFVLPIFEYVCNQCEHQFEEIVSSQEAIPPCPECSSTSTRKLLSASSPLTGKTVGSVPDSHGTGCCGSNPGQKGCIPGSCCGKA